MDKWLHDDFEAGQEDTYVLDAEDVGELLMIKLDNDQGGLFSDWFVEKVMITCSQDPQRLYEFPCGRWVQSESIFFEGKGSIAKTFFVLFQLLCDARIFLAFLTRQRVGCRSNPINFLASRERGLSAYKIMMSKRG